MIRFYVDNFDIEFVIRYVYYKNERRYKEFFLACLHQDSEVNCKLNHRLCRHFLSYKSADQLIYLKYIEVKVMDLAAVNEKIPIETDENGVIRVGNTRVTLETLVSAFNNGSTAEEIVSQFPVLDLADVYAVITYYLRNRDIVEKYLNDRTLLAQQTKQKNQKNKSMKDIRKRLLARQKQ